MGLVKNLKDNAWFKRYQAPPRRRREGKTDYQARRTMCKQHKAKYNAPKYRYVVRITNTKVICQIVTSHIVGDKCVAQATSPELEKYEIPFRKNYMAAYATGYLLARRVLKKFGLDNDFKGKEELDGEEYHVEDEDREGDHRPFKAILDIGIRRACSGARLWGALKGAVDGGLHIPHNTKRFPGYTGGEKAEYDAEAHAEKIFGGHVKEYMETMKDEDEEKYKSHFAKYIEAGIEDDDFKDIMSEGLEKMKDLEDEDPKEAKSVTYTRDGQTVEASDGTSHTRYKKISLEARRGKVAKAIEDAQKKMLEEDDD